MNYNGELLFADLNQEPPPVDDFLQETETNTVAPVSKRQENFTTDEDKLLVSAWLNVSLDPVTGTDQKVTQFWKRIAKYYEEHKSWSNERSEKSLVSRWTKISKDVSKFCAHYGDVDRLQQSGTTQQEKIAAAKVKFKADVGHAFVLDHCWVILRFQQKWMDESKRILAKKKQKAPRKSTISLNVEDDGEEVEDLTNVERPLGRKGAKEEVKKARIKEQTGGIAETSKSLQLLEELSAKRLEKENKRNEQFELLYAAEQKQIALKEQEIAILARSKEDEIMALDTSSMSQLQAAYFIGRQKEIVAKRASNLDQ